MDTGQGRYFSMERTGSGVQDARFHLQPLREYLPAWAGLPFLSVARYTTPATDLPDVDTLSAPLPDERTSDFSLGADDVLEGGLRWRRQRPVPRAMRVVRWGRCT